MTRDLLIQYMFKVRRFNIYFSIINFKNPQKIQC